MPLKTKPATPAVRWKLWYPFVSRRLLRDGVLFLNYGFETVPPVKLPLTPADEVNRGCIQLYHHVATLGDIRGKRVLEVSSGHGGGASYLARTLHPERYTGLDLNPDAVRFCQNHYHVAGLDFMQGDAENLSFGDNTIDVIINIEASHCYPHFTRFLSEVARVLKPGGRFLYADLRFSEGIAAWERELAASPLAMTSQRVINTEVLCSMDVNSQRSLELVVNHLPAFLHPLGRDFAGVRDSRTYSGFASGQMTYRSYSFTKV